MESKPQDPDFGINPENFHQGFTGRNILCPIRINN